MTRDGLLLPLGGPKAPDLEVRSGGNRPYLAFFAGSNTSCSRAEMVRRRETLNPKPKTLNPKPKTLNLKP